MHPGNLSFDRHHKNERKEEKKKIRMRVSADVGWKESGRVSPRPISLISLTAHLLEESRAPGKTYTTRAFCLHEPQLLKSPREAVICTSSSRRLPLLFKRRQKPARLLTREQPSKAAIVSRRERSRRRAREIRRRRRRRRPVPQQTYTRDCNKKNKKTKKKLQKKSVVAELICQLWWKWSKTGGEIRVFSRNS